MRVLNSCFVFLISLVPADAQQPSLTDAQKRKLHVPYVRAVTDCIAANVGNHAHFQQAVAINSFGALIKEALLGACLEAGQKMVAAHDHIYGSGGMQFVTGPYLNDVERAVRARLSTKISAAQAEISRLSEVKRVEQERVSARRAEELSVSEEVTAAVRARTYACVRKEAGSMIMTSERAEIVAKAAAVFCRAEIEALAEAVRQGSKLRGESTGLDIDALAKERVTEIVTAEIVKMRAEIARAAFEQKKDPIPTF